MLPAHCMHASHPSTRQIDIGIRGHGRHQHHVVKGGDQKPPIGQEKMRVVKHDPSLKAALAWLAAWWATTWDELQLGPGTAAGNAPRQIVSFGWMLPGRRPCGWRPSIIFSAMRLGCGDIRFKRGPHGIDRKGVARKCAADAHGIGQWPLWPKEALIAIGDFAALKPYTATGMPPAMAFAQGDDVGIEAVGGGIPAGSRGQGMGLVDDRDRCRYREHRARSFSWKAGSGQNHSAVGHDRLGQHAGHVLVGQGRLEGLEVIELHHAGQGFLGDAGIDVVIRAQDQIVRPGRCEPGPRRCCRGSIR